MQLEIRRHKSSGFEVLTLQPDSKREDFNKELEDYLKSKDMMLCSSIQFPSAASKGLMMNSRA